MPALPRGRLYEPLRNQRVVVAAEAGGVVEDGVHLVCDRLKKRCDTQWRADATAPGIRKPVLEPGNGLGALSERTKLPVNESGLYAMVAGGGSYGNVR